MDNNFDYEGAKKAGYSDQEIKSYLLGSTEKPPQNQPKFQPEDENDSAWGKIKKNAMNFWESRKINSEKEPPIENQESKINPKLLKNVKFDVQSAIDSGYSIDEINDYLEENQPKKSKTEQVGRLGAQYGLGILQGTVPGMVYDVSHEVAQATAPSEYRKSLSEDLERLMDQKEMGDWDEKDEELLNHIQEQIRDPEKAKQFENTTDLSIRGLAEKATGLDLHPEGVLEHAANWAGFIKNPNNIKNLFTIGLSPKTLTKAIFPGPTEAIRGLGAATGLKMAEDGNFGPLGTLGAAIAGDLIGHSPKGIYNVVTNPKQSAAQFLNLVTRNNTKKQITEQLVKDFEQSGIKMDAGTLTGSPLVQMTQARLAQSGLTGTPLENLRKELSSQITREYEKIASEVGEMAFENNHQASEAIMDALKVEEIALNIPKENSRVSRSLEGRVSVEPQPDYQHDLLNRIAPQEFENTRVAGETLKNTAQDIKEPIKRQFNERFNNIKEELRNIESGPQPQLASELEKFVTEHQGSLLLGESAAEARVLRSAENLLNRLRVEGGYIGVTVDELIKTRRTLGDIANWEFGGSDYTSAYKKLVGDINAAIDRTLQEVSPELRSRYQQLNGEYSAYKDAFENKNLKSLFEPKNHNYNAIFNEFSTNPDKLSALENIIGNSPEGQQIVSQVKRDYAQKITNKSDVTPRDIRDLASVLGDRHAQDLERYFAERQFQIEHPLPRATQQNRLGVQAQLPKTTAERGLEGRRVSETATERAQQGVRKKMYEYLSKKDAQKIMQEMETIEGIRKLKRALQLTPEGKKVFEDLSRFKISEMIDKKMKDAVTENVKMGTFSNLAKTTKDKAILRELLGKDAFNKLELLQKNTGRLAKSAERFLNTSQSGTTLVDMGLIGAATTGVLTGNPFIAMPAILKIGGSYAVASLLGDPIFLKELEKAILTNNPKKFNDLLNQMRPIVQNSLKNSYQENE